MRIAPFWFKARHRGPNPRGSSWPLEVWGWSHQSEEDAAAQAEARLAKVVAALATGREAAAYDYAAVPAREELLAEPVPGAAITRNGYGCEVLNSDRAAFIDVDLPGPGLLDRLFRGGRDGVRDRALEAIAAVLQAEGRHARAYETAKGLRVLLTDQPYDAAAADTQTLFEKLGCDPLYLRLCKRQRCFRARLTPKPWRMDMTGPPARWPYSPAAKGPARAWLREYESRSAKFCTARFLDTLGSGRTHAELRPIVTLHDRACRATAKLPLA